MNDSTINDSLTAMGVTGTYHAVSDPNNTTTTIILALISGVLAPLVKSIIEKWNERRKSRKLNK